MKKVMQQTDLLCRLADRRRRQSRLAHRRRRQRLCRLAHRRQRRSLCDDDVMHLVVLRQNGMQMVHDVG
jgi:hypothetical protein